MTEFERAKAVCALCLCNPHTAECRIQEAGPLLGSEEKAAAWRLGVAAAHKVAGARQVDTAPRPVEQTSVSPTTHKHIWQERRDGRSFVCLSCEEQTFVLTPSFYSLSKVERASLEYVPISQRPDPPGREKLLNWLNHWRDQVRIK